MRNAILSLTVLLLLSACHKDPIIIPQYQKITVIDPAPARPLDLRNPPIVAMSGKQLADMGNLPENLPKIFYVLTGEGLRALLQDDVDKFDFAQYESKRADYYADFIKKYNSTIDKRNEEELKKHK